MMKRQTIKGKTNLRVRSFLVGDELIKVIEKNTKKRICGGLFRSVLVEDCVD